MANRQLKVLPVDDCPNISRNTKAIVKKFQQFVQQFSPELEPFDEFKRFGFWKMLTVRDFLGESMMIVTVYPNPDSDVKFNSKISENNLNPYIILRYHPKLNVP